MKPSHVVALTIFGVALFTSASFGQSTWGGLQFGMSQNKVAQVVKQKGMTIGSSGQVPETSALQPPYLLLLPGLEKTIPFTVNLFFPQGKLTKVELRLDTGTWITEIGNTYSAVSLVNDYVRKALMAKYGPSFTQTGSCDPDKTDIVDAMVQDDSVSCNESWHGDGQLVSVFWWYDKLAKTYVYFLSYEKAPSDL